jgi:hypothetical protein
VKKMGGSRYVRSLADYTDHLIQASKVLNSTDDATHVVTPGGLNTIRILLILICCVLLFNVFILHLYGFLRLYSTLVQGIS